MSYSVSVKYNRTVLLLKVRVKWDNGLKIEQAWPQYRHQYFDRHNCLGGGLGVVNFFTIRPLLDICSGYC